MTKRLCLVSILVILFVLPLHAQQNWGGGVDGETLHFGFKFQYVGAEYKIFKRDDWQGLYPDPDVPGAYLIDSQLKSVSSPVTPGFGLGFVSDLKLGSNTNLRFTPGLVFSDIVGRYEYENGEIIEKKVESTYVELPIGLKLKSNRRENFRAYMIGGIKYSMDIVSSKKKDDSEKIASEKFLKNVPNALWYEAGIGFDLYFEFFKLSPEIKFAQTFRSVLDSKDRAINPYIAPVDKLLLRNLQFSLYFE